MHYLARTDQSLSRRNIT